MKNVIKTTCWESVLKVLLYLLRFLTVQHCIMNHTTVYFFSVVNSGIALNMLEWICIIIRDGYKTADNMKGDAFTKLVRKLSRIFVYIYLLFV